MGLEASLDAGDLLTVLPASRVDNLCPTARPLELEVVYVFAMPVPR